MKQSGSNTHTPCCERGGPIPSLQFALAAPNILLPSTSCQLRTLHRECCWHGHLKRPLQWYKHVGTSFSSRTPSNATYMLLLQPCLGSTGTADSIQHAHHWDRDVSGRCAFHGVIYVGRPE